jgi:hypothetical protein
MSNKSIDIALVSGGGIGDNLSLQEIVKAELYRGKPHGYDATPDETICVNDLIVTTGRVYLAKRIAGGDTVASAMAYMAVGTVSTAAALADTTLTGEIKRKALSTNSTLASSNLHTCVSTFGGAADAITSIAITEAGIFNHASSGNGTMFQRVTFASVTLAASDLLKVTLETNVGSS